MFDELLELKTLVDLYAFPKRLSKFEDNQSAVRKKVELEKVGGDYDQMA